MSRFAGNRFVCQQCTSLLRMIARKSSSSPSEIADAKYPALMHQKAFRAFSISACRSIRSIERESRQDTGVQADSVETLAERVRSVFGDTLPNGLLTKDEYPVYERLYGPPGNTVNLEDFEDVKEPETDLKLNDPNAIRQMILAGDHELLVGDPMSRQEADEENEISIDVEAESEEISEEELDRRLNAEMNVQRHEREPLENTAFQDSEGDDMIFDEVEPHPNEVTRNHPITSAGKSGMGSDTLQLPRSELIEPVDELLSNTPNTRLREVAHRALGGAGLPSSPLTINSRGRSQKPVHFRASQERMGEVEGDVFLAAIMPASYAAVMSCLVEVRKRLGKSWLSDLTAKESGPRILDAGGGGAGVVAWREILKAEWQASIDEGQDVSPNPPTGRSTVVTGSDTLRHRVSRFLDDTTFLPRLPDYVHLENPENTQRKVFDVIIAPHTLCSLEEGVYRRNHVQNLWSMLNPNGGVLVMIEKGVPEGFDAIAMARQFLLDNHITPDDKGFTNRAHETADGIYSAQEQGMIIAPCTNHVKCPMYLKSGPSQSRRDTCHFSQRYIRPQYQQHLLGAKGRNHEDVKFSYIATMKGNNALFRGIQQGESTTRSAFEADLSMNKLEDLNNPEDQKLAGSHYATLGLPRIISSPLKRQGHVLMDVCTSGGKLERWTVPRSWGKQAYRDARKSSWGDLWALGAKTRVPRRPNTGERNLEDREMIEADDGDDKGGSLPRKRRPRKQVAREKQRNTKRDRLNGKSRGNVHEDV